MEKLISYAGLVEFYNKLKPKLIGKKGTGAHAEVFNDDRNTATGNYSHAEGSLTHVQGYASHAEGYRTKTTNSNEHAEGMYNESHKGTIHSIGIGYEGERMNAVEVIEDGDIFIYGVGDYTGSNIGDAETLQRVLHNKIDNPDEGSAGQVLKKTDDGVEWGDASGGGGIIEGTYEEIKTLRDSGKLSVGSWYRITDFVTTTTQENTQSAQHPFDVLVLATDVNMFSEHARAMHHVGDTYFSTANIEAWDIWYCFDNDVNRFKWADETNGKGVIWRMVDEWCNDCPYDFKNILYLSDGQFYYTFDHDTEGIHVDMTIFGNDGVKHGCYSNIIKKHALNSVAKLNETIFKNYGTIYHCVGNYTGYNSSKNIFGTQCRYNVVGNYANSNKFGDKCSFIVLGGFCNSNIFGESCTRITFGEQCQVIKMGDGCDDITIGNDCTYITFGSEDFVRSFYRSINIGNSISRIYLSTTSTTSSTLYIQNVQINGGVKGTYSSWKNLNVQDLNRIGMITFGSYTDTKINV